MSDEEKRREVSQYYSDAVLKDTKLQTNCVLYTDGAPAGKIVKEIHPEILDKAFGCGSPIPVKLEGATVLDLGCGTGKDVYICSKLVGAEGEVIGLDMTDDSLKVARKHVEYHREKFGFEKSNVKLVKALIEEMGTVVKDESVDVVISNCVLNLTPDKEPVFKAIFKSLKYGGELYFADVYASRRLPESVLKNRTLWGECIAGALYVEDFRRILQKVGFGSFQVVESHSIAVRNPGLAKLVKGVKFCSSTIRVVKTRTPQDDREEDYGQTATYVGPEESFQWDMYNSFEKGKAVPISYNTAVVLKEGRYRDWFTVSEPKEHGGLFYPEAVGVHDFYSQPAGSKEPCGCCADVDPGEPSGLTSTCGCGSAEAKQTSCCGEAKQTSCCGEAERTCC